MLIVVRIPALVVVVAVVPSDKNKFQNNSIGKKQEYIFNISFFSEVCFIFYKLKTVLQIKRG